MKTPAEIRDLLNALKESGELRKDPTYFVLVDILVDLNERLTVLESKLERRRHSKRCPEL